MYVCKILADKAKLLRMEEGIIRKAMKKKKKISKAKTSRSSTFSSMRKVM